MPVGELYINGYDAFSTWGISLSETALSTLMTPSPVKDRVTNESRLEHGKRVLNTNVKTAYRDVTLEMHLTAQSKAEFLTRYASFCSILEQGALNIRTSYQQGVVYKMLYVSCSQFSEFNLRLAKFTLRLLEPNTKDRSNV